MIIDHECPSDPEPVFHRAAVLSLAAFLAGGLAACATTDGRDVRVQGEAAVGVAAVDASPSVSASLGQLQRGRGWQEDFPREEVIRAAGQYQGDQTWEFESFSPLELEPSETATFKFFKLDVLDEVVVDEDQPGLVPNEAGGEPFYRRGRGAISALGWVEQPFADVRVSSDVNTQGGRRGAGAESRQGVIARWNEGNSYYWFYIDFTTGRYEILRSRGLGIFEPFADSVGEVRGFGNRKAYRLVFEVLGDTLWGRVFDVRPGGQLGRLVGDTGRIRDPEPLRAGISGVLTELALGAPFVPLEGSFARVSSIPISDRTPDLPVRTASVDGSADVARAVSLAAEGQREGAARELEALLERRPSAEARTQLAWIYATASESSLRRPEQALELAQAAVDDLLRRLNESTGAKPPTEELLRAGLTLAAAYAANGVFKTELTTQQMQQRAIAPGSGLTLEQVADELASSHGGGAIAFASWAHEVGSHLTRTQPSPEIQQLTDTAGRALETFQRGGTLGDVPLP